MKIRLRRRIATVARLALALGCIAGCETTDPFGVFYDVRFRVSPNSPCDDIARTLAANLPLQIKYNSGVGDSRGCDASMSLLDTKATVFVRIFKRPDLDHISVDTRQLQVHEVSDEISPSQRDHAGPLQLAVRSSLHRSLDAMLERRSELVEAGKAYMARRLLRAEAAAREAVADAPGTWYHILWDAMDLASLEAFRATPLKIITYNYDRSLEYALVSSLQQQFTATVDECAKALDCIGPIHLHGQLGFLPGFSADRKGIVSYGSTPGGITDEDWARAARNIRIVHEPTPMDEAFMRARDAISCAEHVAFLGFGYVRQNVERLQLDTCMKHQTVVYLCQYRFSTQQDRAIIRPQFSKWSNLFPGTEEEDIRAFYVGSLSCYCRICVWASIQCPRRRDTVYASAGEDICPIPLLCSLAPQWRARYAHAICTSA